VTDLPLRAILDTSAVLAFVAGSIHVGETIGEIADEGAGFAVPVVCLLAAADRVTADQQPMLDVLASHPHAIVLPLISARWRRVSAAGSLLGDVGRACAALPVVSGKAGYVMTAEPEAYGEGIETIGIWST
jgi:hypothetical protein